MRQNILIALKLLAIFLAITGTFLLVQPPRHAPIVSTIDGR